MLPAILIGLSVLTLLPLQPIGMQAEPITSKPIEGEGGNLPWEFSVIQAAQEHGTGKGRKVTPKSIFDIPYRNGCPTGHHADGERCIPTVNIDPKELLQQAVLAEFGGNIGNTEEFDYSDDGSAIAGGLGVETSFNIYDTPQKFNSELPTNFDSSGQLPSPDAPLKFNFFGLNLPSNDNKTMLDGILEDYDDFIQPVVSNNKTLNNDKVQNNQTTPTEAVQVANNQTNQLVHNKTLLSTYLNNTLKTALLTESSNISTNLDNNNAFSIDNIDAISLPAIVTVPANLTTSAEQLVNSAHKVSLYKGDSAVQLITSTSLLNDQKQQQNEKHQTELTDLLQAEALLPILDRGKKVIYNGTNEMSSAIADYDDADIASDEQPNKEKTDHTRSIVDNLLLSVSDLSAQENDFTTTLEPDATTSFQLDDTTIIEAVNPPTIELQELKAKRARKPSQINVQQQIELEEKSKVEPVAQLSVDHEVTMTTAAADTTSETTTAPLPTISTHKSEIIDGVVDVGLNRFTYLDDDVANLMYTTTTTTTESWGIISELVKGPSIKTTAKQIILATTKIPLATTITVNNQDIAAAEQSKTHDTKFVETSSDSHINKLTTYIEMETTTVVAETENTTTTTTTTNSANNNNNKEYLLTNADVTVNVDDVADVDADADDTSEIVFVVTNKKNLPTTTTTTITTAVESEESFMPTTTTTITETPITNKEITEIATETVTSKRWSKVMPIFERNNRLSTTTTTTTTKTTDIDEQLADEVRLNIESTPIKSGSISINDKRKTSRRNSKIIQLDKYPLAASVNSLSESTTIKYTPTTETNTRNQFGLDPFWWLPTNWHLDRHADVEGRPLLLRLWTTFTSDK